MYYLNGGRSIQVPVLHLKMIKLLVCELLLSSLAEFDIDAKLITFVRWLFALISTFDYTGRYIMVYHQHTHYPPTLPTHIPTTHH